jgi:hypothetical protein
MAKQPPPPSTIGANPLDQLVSGTPVAAMTGSGRRRPGLRPDTTVLTVTIPTPLADRLERLVTITPGADLDGLATEALRIVLDRLECGLPAAEPKPARKGASKKRKGKDGKRVVVIVGD